ncbi:ABC transporter [Anaerocolumna cellulosilytica]|uniref:ABC transporter n=1 Tax=Anaerocolumna cellulosilytica TaxID=433286 RepID=A0A6S6QY28_9FIRM|nr:ABC transporter ATP-binding protein [Anaerocolumna cellulosilytica]MBB5194152.1 ATP-binding cassette subfamily B protein [Anaerocolumna cellulosilytica]BCJ94636.1 ABC transporter [Anaerocolumna cellulosilytica]
MGAIKSNKTKKKSNIEKPRDTKSVLKRLSKYLYQDKWRIIVAIVLTITSNLFALIGPMLSGYAVDAIEPGKGAVMFDKVFYYGAWMILFYLLSSILSYILSILMLKISQKVTRQMREDIFEKLVELPVGYYDTRQSGDIISRISYDIDTISTSLSTDVVQIFASVITVVGSFIMMIMISPILVLVMLITIPLSIGYTKYMSGRVRPLFRKRSEKLGQLNGFVEEMVSGQKTIKAYAREQVVTDKFDSINKEAVEAYYDADYYGSIVGPTVNFINNLSLSLVTVFGALLYLFGKMTLGNISAFVLYSRKFSGPINEAANIVSELQSAAAAAERVFKIMDEEPEMKDIPDAKELTDVKGCVTLNHVTFGYSQDKMIIKNLNMEAKEGNLIAIVGPTGAGKTTIINLLMRFYDVNQGNIQINNQNISEVTRKSLRQAYTMVLQDTWVFHGTIFENIAYGKENATMEEVVEAAKAAKIHSFIKKLPEGYHTILSEDGMNMSKGQKQLLTIARAMLMDAKILILDEATSNVDTRTEIQIQAAMRKLMADKTCFVIAHRLSTIQNADLILVVDQGNVIEQGNHKELMERQGFYYKLYSSQFE